MEPLFSGVQKGNGRDNLAHFGAEATGQGSGTTWAPAAAGLQGTGSGAAWGLAPAGLQEGGRGKGDLLSVCREVELGIRPFARLTHG